ncbi:MAG: hypothetical protein M9916_08320 [Crocinitomicaceae bacterium]|nr:hypothetical protein [Crocinitomicaceae bacterium]
MKKLALALTLVFATGYITNAVYAANSSTYTVFQNGDKDKKKSNNKKSCSSESAQKSCSGQSSQKSCCSSEKK